MATLTSPSFETVGCVSLASGPGGVDGADVKTIADNTGELGGDGLSLDLLEALTLLARDRVRAGGLKLLGEDGLLPLITQQLMQAALDAEMDEHLAAEAVRVGGRGSRSGGNARNGYRPKKVMTEVGPDRAPAGAEQAVYRLGGDGLSPHRALGDRAASGRALACFDSQAAATAQPR